ncbi:MAG: glycosyltransferase [Bacteroidia bacterium]
MKIFLGNINLAGQLTDIKTGFTKLGVDSIVATYTSGGPGDIGEVDYNFSDYKYHSFKHVRPSKLQVALRDIFNIDGKVFRKAIKECDVFIFMWDTFKYNYSDLAVLKKKGKKIIHIFCGDDARWYFSEKQEFESFGLRPLEYEDNYNYSAEYLNKKLEKLRSVEKYADFIFSRLDQAQLQLRPYYRWNMMVLPEKYNHSPIQREKNPVIAHAPTSRKAKGTSFVFEAFDRLKREGIEFTPLLIEGVKNTEALKMYESADMVIDQLIIPGTGKLATESLALGKVVLAHMAYDNYPQKNPKECPIVDVNPDTLYDVLKKLIADHKLRTEIAARGRAYVIDHLDTTIFCKKVLSLLNGEAVPFDYKPTFFNEKFVPESKEAATVYNKWNRFVENENWYKTSIKKTERNGLIF